MLCWLRARDFCLGSALGSSARRNLTNEFPSVPPRAGPGSARAGHRSGTRFPGPTGASGNDPDELAGRYWFHLRANLRFYPKRCYGVLFPHDGWARRRVPRGCGKAIVLVPRSLTRSLNSGRTKTITRTRTIRRHARPGLRPPRCDACGLGVHPMVRGGRMWDDGDRMNKPEMLQLKP
jgi:hypothetical protein